MNSKNVRYGNHEKVQNTKRYRKGDIQTSKTKYKKYEDNIKWKKQNKNIKEQKKETEQKRKPCNGKITIEKKI